MNTTELLWAIGRATVFTSASVLVALALVSLLRVRSPRLHRAAWLLAIMPGWLLVPWTWRVEAPPAATPADSLRVEVLTTATLSPPTPTVLAPTTTPAARTNPAPPLLIVYLGGMIAVVAVGLLRYLRFVRRLPRSEEALDPEWQREWQRQVHPLRIRRPLDLCVSPDLGPLLCFVPCRYLVLVPRPLWSALARAQRIAILRHELAHWRRGDLWWSLAIRTLALPQWFNPLAWLAVRRFDEAGEWACDDLVSRGRRSHELAFARSLLATAEFATTNSPGTAAIQGGQLARRVRRLVSHSFKEEAMMKKFLVLVPLSAIVVAQAIRIERVTAEEPATTSTETDYKLIAKANATTSSPAGVTPAYIIEPPDVLTLNGVRLIPKSHQKIARYDGLLVQVTGALPDHPLADAFAVNEDGKLDLGPTYGQVEVAGLTIDEAKIAVEKQLHEIVTNPKVSLSLAFAAPVQQVQGKYLVAPDGRVNLGVYGTVFIAGLTIDEARAAIEKQLSQRLRDPQVVVDVDQYNSKKYYVITRHPGHGDNVVAAPITGYETVLDALALVDDALKQASTRIWISRPTENGAGDSKILPVNWNQIVDGASTATNYQLLAGDRLFVVNHDQTDDLSPAAKAAPLPQPKFVSSPYADMELRPEAAKDSTEFNIDILEDRARALSEFEALRGQAPFVAVDSATIGPALRALASHGLIRKLSAPKISCELGDTATMSTDSLQEHDGPEINLRLTANRTDRGKVMEVQLVTMHESEKRKIDFAVYVKPGQTVLIPITDESNKSKSASAPNPICLAITPSFPKSPTTSAAPKSYYYQPSEPPTAE